MTGEKNTLTRSILNSEKKDNTFLTPIPIYMELIAFFWMMDSWFKDSVCHYQCKCQVFGGFWIESTQGRIKVTTIYYQPINHYWLIGNASLGCIGSWKMFAMISLKMKVKAKSVHEHKIQDFAKNSYGRSSFDRVMRNNHL